MLNTIVLTRGLWSVLMLGSLMFLFYRWLQPYRTISFFMTLPAVFMLAVANAWILTMMAADDWSAGLMVRWFAICLPITLLFGFTRYAFAFRSKLDSLAEACWGVVIVASAYVVAVSALAQWNADPALSANSYMWLLFSSCIAFLVGVPMGLQLNKRKGFHQALRLGSKHGFPRLYVDNHGYGYK